MTTAQKVTRICYTEATRNLGYKIQTEGLADLKECVKIIRSYNEFDHQKINDVLEIFANFPQYYNPNNPNNGKDLLTYEIGREGSPVLYISCYFFEDMPNYYLDQNKEIKSFTKDLFIKNMKELGRLALADEADLTEGGLKHEFRFWWD
jgi:hypothetical protein